MWPFSKRKSLQVNMRKEWEAGGNDCSLFLDVEIEQKHFAWAEKMVVAAFTIPEQATRGHFKGVASRDGSTPEGFAIRVRCTFLRDADDNGKVVAYTYVQNRAQAVNKMFADRKIGSEHFPDPS